MADIFFKPSHEDLADERKKALKGTTEEEWCNRCVNTLVRILRKDPVAYRQYGPYWWNLKKSVISRQPEAIHGDFIDDLWAERTDYGDEVDNILSAILYAQQFIEEHIYGSREHTVYLDSDDGDGWRAEIYVLEDEDMD